VVCYGYGQCVSVTPFLAEDRHMRSLTRFAISSTAATQKPSCASLCYCKAI